MIEYVVEESVRPDGAVRWTVTEMGTSVEWSCFSEEEGLVLACSRLGGGVVRVGNRDGSYRDYHLSGAQQRVTDLRKMGAAANFNSTSGFTPNPNMAHPQPAPQATLLGVRFIIANAGKRGEFWWSDADKAWITDQDTYDHLRVGSNTEMQRFISELRKARMEGRDVVAGRVSNNPRRPAPAPRQRKGDLSDLLERTKRMVVQIAAMSDKGPIPDGQVAELSKTYAALQGEFNESMACVEEIKDNLSIMRAIMFEHSDPRNARDAIA